MLIGVSGVVVLFIRKGNLSGKRLRNCKTFETFTEFTYFVNRLFEIRKVARLQRHAKKTRRKSFPVRNLVSLPVCY